MLANILKAPKWMGLLFFILFIYFLGTGCFFTIGYFKSPNEFPEELIKMNCDGDVASQVTIYSKVQFAFWYYDNVFIAFTVILIIALIAFYFWVVSEYY